MNEQWFTPDVTLNDGCRSSPTGGGRGASHHKKRRRWHGSRCPHVRHLVQGPGAGLGVLDECLGVQVGRLLAIENSAHLDFKEIGEKEWEGVDRGLGGAQLERTVEAIKRAKTDYFYVAVAGEYQE